MPARLKAVPLLCFIGISLHVLCPIQLRAQNFELLSKAQAQAEARRGIIVFPKDKTVVDMTIEELHHYYSSELRRLEYSPSQDELNGLLEKIGGRVRSYFQDFSNTSSKEYVLLHDVGNDRRINRTFNYLISYLPNGDKPLLLEYRTDNKNHAIDQKATKGYFITSGYVGFSLNFHPSYQQASRFRYLGMQASDPRAHIVAFAQKADVKNLQIEYMDIITGKSEHLPVQGLVWVDPDTYQILRLRINLLNGANKSYMTEQSTDIKFSEVLFEDKQRKSWLPREVVVATKLGGLLFRSQHRYTGYKSFDVTSDFKLERPKSAN
jgi:hypothetical protein